jgi:hypothetical protein
MGLLDASLSGSRSWGGSVRWTDPTGQRSEAKLLVGLIDNIGLLSH